MDDELRELLVAGNADETAGRFSTAEANYLQAMARISPADTELRGTLFINLGTNASKAGRDVDAIRYHQHAIELLEGLKGEAVLQSAHAHLNIAGILLSNIDVDPRAVEFTEAALKRYQKYPYTPQATLADAMATHAEALATCQKVVPASFLAETWMLMQSLQFAELTEGRVVNFLLIFLQCERLSGGDPYKKLIDERRAWAGPDFGAWITRIQRRQHSLAESIGNFMRRILGRFP